VPALQAGKVGQQKDDGIPVDFLMPAASGVSTVRPCTSGLGLSPKPDTWAKTRSPQVNLISPENFRFSGRIPNPSSSCKGCEIRIIWKN